MGVEFSDRLRKIADARDVSESTVFERALERGLEDLWVEVVLDRYLTGELDREEAVDLVGVEAVARAEREVDAVEEDVRWGLLA